MTWEDLSLKSGALQRQILKRLKVKGCHGILLRLRVFKQLKHKSVKSTDAPGRVPISLKTVLKAERRAGRAQSLKRHSRRSPELL